jgi:hypothetical protein
MLASGCVYDPAKEPGSGNLNYRQLNIDLETLVVNGIVMSAN